MNYIEWAQNIQQLSWERERVDQELTDLMRKAYAAVRKVVGEYAIDLRTVSFALAILRISEAARARMYMKEDIQLLMTRQT